MSKCCSIARLHIAIAHICRDRRGSGCCIEFHVHTLCKMLRKEPQRRCTWSLFLCSPGSVTTAAAGGCGRGTAACCTRCPAAPDVTGGLGAVGSHGDVTTAAAGGCGRGTAACCTLGAVGGPDVIAAAAGGCGRGSAACCTRCFAASLSCLSVRLPICSQPNRLSRRRSVCLTGLRSFPGYQRCPSKMFCCKEAARRDNTCSVAMHTRSVGSDLAALHDLSSAMYSAIASAGWKHDLCPPAGAALSGGACRRQAFPRRRPAWRKPLPCSASTPGGRPARHTLPSGVCCGAAPLNCQLALAVGAAGRGGASLCSAVPVRVIVCTSTAGAARCCRAASRSCFVVGMPTCSQQNCLSRRRPVHLTRLRSFPGYKRCS